MLCYLYGDTAKYLPWPYMVAATLRLGFWRRSALCLAAIAAYLALSRLSARLSASITWHSHVAQRTVILRFLDYTTSLLVV